MPLFDFQKFRSTARQALSFQSRPTEESFPDLPTVLIWIRFLLAAAYGSFLGLSGVRSGTMLLHNLNLIAFVPIMYCRLYLGTEGDAFGSQILFSGLVQALALSLLCWIYFYTALHEGGETKLASLLVQHLGMMKSSSSNETVMGADDATSTVMAGSDSGAAPSTMAQEDSEF
jgi:hypothetical protein